MLNPLEASQIDSTALADWTPEQQIAHMLRLCEAQMESALSESDVAVESLIKVFTSMTETARAVKAMTQALPSEQSAAAAGLGQQLDAITRQMTSAIIAFQFYDKLSQRLDHVRYSVTTLAAFVCDPQKSSQREQWCRLFTTLRGQYRTEEERRIFEMMVEGASADAAREHIHQTTMTLRAAATGDIELF